MVVKVEKPQDMAKARAAAWGAALGEPVSVCENLAQVSNNTIRNWMSSDWWPAEVEAARQLIPMNLRNRALAGILRGLEDGDEYAAMAKWVADRMIPDLAPPVSRRDHTSDGRPITAMPTRIEVQLVDVDDEDDE